MNRLGVIAQATALAILTAGAGWWFVGVFVSGSVALPLVLMVVTVTATLVGIHLIRVPSLLVDLLVGTVCVAAVLFVVAVVDRTVDAKVVLAYTIPYEDTELTADEVADSRRHQFLGFCRGHSRQEPLPVWPPA